MSFVELKQIGHGWSDALRPSQKLWLEAALRPGTDEDRFLVLEWSISATEARDP